MHIKQIIPFKTMSSFACVHWHHWYLWLSVTVLYCIALHCIIQYEFFYLGALNSRLFGRWLMNLDHRPFLRTGVVTDAVPMLRLRIRSPDTFEFGGNGGFELAKCNTLSELPKPLSSSNSMGVVELLECDSLNGVLLGVVDLVGSVVKQSSSHDRSSERLFRNDLRNLSTNRVWNLFKLL